MFLAYFPPKFRLNPVCIPLYLKTAKICQSNICVQEKLEGFVTIQFQHKEYVCQVELQCIITGIFEYHVIMLIV